MRRLLPLLFLVSCSNAEATSAPEDRPNADAGTPEAGGPNDRDGGVDVPACAEPAPAPSFVIASEPTTRSSWVVVTGTAPIGFEDVTVNGSKRGVRADPARGVWSYTLQHAGGTKVTLEVTIDGSTKTHVADVANGAALASRDLAPGKHTVGAWMFAWFNADPSWDCVSPWRPAGGFVTWDGSIGWARKQILDQMDAHLDVVGLQYSDVAGGSWPNVVNVMKALRQLIEEGYAPPRFFPMFDTIIWGERRFEETGGAVDLASTGGRADFYSLIAGWYAAFASELGATNVRFANARMDGKPFVSMWHSSTDRFTGVSTSAANANLNDSFFADLKSRFAAQFSETPWIVAHPNNWRHGTGADEITLMFGPPTHFFTQTYGARKPTVNVEPGFWNPTTNSFYLARSGGTNYASAWTSALAVKGSADHLYIDSWNETGEGSGIFDAPPLTYAASTDGPCADTGKPWMYKHDDSWGPTSRHYIDQTRKNASSWNDVPDLDAEIIADDLPTTMKPGQRRWVSVLVRNRGDASWTAGSAPVLRSKSGDFPVKDIPMTPEPNAVIRGYPAVYTFEIVAPCEPGSHPIELGLADASGAIGETVKRTISISK